MAVKSERLSGLAGLLLGYVVGMAALATLWPLDFRVHPHAWMVQGTFEDVPQSY